jgi:hypothetical protein
MNWRLRIEKQIEEASNQKCISKELKQLAKDMLQGDTEFNLIFVSGRGKYVNLRFTQELKPLTKKLLLSKYGAKIYKYYKP